MKKPVLVIMAAGMGSRYGGLKQIDPIDEQGHIIMDFSIFDAKRAGFEKVIFIIKKENEADFKEVIGNRIKDVMEVEYVFQDLHNLPEGYEVPEGRVKPWGTAHAVLSCIDVIDGPFAVINADDYYGRDAFYKIYKFLKNSQDDEKYRYAMVGYKLENTLTENGHVARGVCTIDENQHMVKVVERTRIERKGEGAAYTEDDGLTWNPLEPDSIVSMNLWGFSESFLKEIKAGFEAFLEKGLKENPMKCEYFLPTVVTNLLEADKATVSVLTSQDKWYGVTYKEDKPVVVHAIQNMKNNGVYPEQVWCGRAEALMNFQLQGMVDEWSGDYGCGVKYFSQDSVIKLAPAAGIELEESLSPAEKLKVVQKLMAEGDERAAKIYDTIGVYFGNTIAYYAMFYDIKHVIIMGRVTSCEGGSLILDRANEVLEKEYPELAKKITLHIPDEKSRRVGQSVAAASLPNF